MVENGKQNGIERNLDGVLVLQILMENLGVKREVEEKIRDLFGRGGFRSSINQEKY